MHHEQQLPPFIMDYSVFKKTPQERVQLANAKSEHKRFLKQEAANKAEPVKALSTTEVLVAQ